MGLSYSAEDKIEIERLKERYPKPAAALLPVLHLTQKRFGHLSIEAQTLVSQTLDVPAVRVHEVVTFYEMYHEHSPGQIHLELCTNISCHLAGADGVMAHLKDRLGIEIGHQTEDGVFGLAEAECLASCGSGPMMRVGNDYYEYLNLDAVDVLLDRLREKAAALAGHHYEQSDDGPHVGPVPGCEPPAPGSYLPPPFRRVGEEDPGSEENGPSPGEGEVSVASGDASMQPPSESNHTSSYVEADEENADSESKGHSKDLDRSSL
jgi:NADH:ubiquinone oxidoreductase subunit E